MTRKTELRYLSRPIQSGKAALLAETYPQSITCAQPRQDEVERVGRTLEYLRSFADAAADTSNQIAPALLMAMLSDRLSEDRPAPPLVFVQPEYADAFSRRQGLVTNWTPGEDKSWTLERFLQDKAAGDEPGYSWRHPDEP